MSCLIPIIVSCLLDPSHVTIRADSHWQVSHRDFYWMDQRPYRGALARLEITAGGDLSRSLRLYYGIGHQSYIDSPRDKGYEYVIGGIEWHPFAR